MKKTLGISLVCALLLMTGCSKSKTESSKEFIEDVVVYAQTQPEIDGGNTTVYDIWVKESDTKYKDICNESGLETLKLSVFLDLQVLFEKYDIPAEVISTKLEEKEGDSYYVTVNLKDKNGVEFEVKLRIQYKEDKVNSVSVLTTE